MDIKEFMISLDLDILFEYTDNTYISTLEDSVIFGKVFSKLENNEDLVILQNNELLTEDGTSLLYKSKDNKFLINLLANWDNDIYQVIISETK